MTATLGAMTALGPMSTDMYLPSLPDIADKLGASVSGTQLTLSGFMIGFAIGQIIYGPIADKYGRKPVLLCGIVIYIIGALGCSLAQSIDWLIAARVAQAFGGAGPVILARAIVRDLHEGPRAARELSMMGAIMTFTPAIAPTFGGLMQVAWGWRASFIASMIIATCFGAFLAFVLPETIRERRSEAISPTAIVRGYAVIAANGSFRTHACLLALTYGGLFAFISASSFVLQGLYGLSPVSYGWAFGACAAACGVGMFGASLLVARLGVNRVIGVGVAILAAAGLGQLLGLLVLPRQPLALIVPMMAYMLGVGLVLPQAMASALMPFPQRAGAASSLAGFTQMSFGAIVGALVGKALSLSALALPVALSLMGVGALALYAASRRAGKA